MGETDEKLKNEIYSLVVFAFRGLDADQERINETKEAIDLLMTRWGD